MRIKDYLKLSVQNLRGWSTKSKVLVIESDDWGSVRMSSGESFGRLKDQQIRVENCPYNRFDALESEQDLSDLFDVLSGIRDKNGCPAVITANYIVANPDFEEIRRHWEYKFELFTETYKKYPEHANSYSILMKGVAAGYFKPQSHGREHVNVARWMKNLKAGAPETMAAFNEGVFGISSTITSERRGSYLAALDKSEDPETDLTSIVKDALDHFHKIFGFQSYSFIAPNYCWNEEVEEALAECGVRHIQSGRVQVNTDLKGSDRYIKHYTGQRNHRGQFYTVRNCHFEPSIQKYGKAEAAVERCLKEIDIAFRWGKPAIVCSHRLNYIGSIVKENSGKNLVLLKRLLTEVKKRWPEVAFLSSDQLGKRIQNGKQ